MRGRQIALILVLAVALGALPITAQGEVEARIIDPRYSVPVPVLAGGSFNITVVPAISGRPVASWIVAPGYNFSLVVDSVLAGGSETVVEVKVPGEVKPELYDLYVKVGGVVLREPRSVWVLAEWPERLQFVQFTDIHIDVVSDGVHSTSYYRAAILLLNALPVQFAIITGDDVDVGSDISSLKLFREVTNTARKPTFIIPGNHDHSQTEEESFRNKYYGLYVGPPTWYRVLGKFLLVGLDTGYEGYIDSVQLRWLEGVLSRHRDKVKIILMHHPLFNYGVFREVQGSYKEAEKLENVMYYSWRDRMEYAREFLRLIEEYGVNAVFSGHVHGDGVVYYNSKTWFVATTTTCGGIRGGDYRGFRIIAIDDEGVVEQLGAPGKDPLRGFSSYNIEKIKAKVAHDAPMSAYSIWIKTLPDFELSLTNASLHFYLNSSITSESYRLFLGADSARGFRIKPYGRYALGEAWIELRPSLDLVLVASSYKDEDPPVAKILMYSPRKPRSGESVLVYVEASDEGWGIKEIYLGYSTNGSQGRIPLLFVQGRTYQARLPPLKAKSVEVRAVAVDFAGNEGSSSEVVINYTVPEEEKPPPEEAKEEKPPEERVEAPPITSLPLILGIVAVGVAAAVVIAYMAYKRR